MVWGGGLLKGNPAYVEDNLTGANKVLQLYVCFVAHGSCKSYQRLTVLV